MAEIAPAVKVEDFAKLNPSLSYTKDKPSDCVLKKGVRYCVREGNGSKGGTNNDPPSSDDTNSRAVTSSLYTTAVDKSPTKATATSVAGSPSKLDGVGATPTPVQKGVVTQCKKWHMVGKGDGCPEIAKKYSIDVMEFKKWNPAVKADCTMLETGFNVCVGVSA